METICEGGQPLDDGPCHKCGRTASQSCGSPGPLKVSEIDDLRQRIAGLEAGLIKLRDCDFVITLPDRMDAVRAIAKAALEGKQ